MEPTTHPLERPRALHRATDGRMIAGVCAGLADYFDVDVVLVRVVVAVLALVAGIGIPLYLAAWILVPEEDAEESIAERLLYEGRTLTGWTTGVHPDREGGTEDAQAS